jgi:hypothetical protein
MWLSPAVTNDAILYRPTVLDFAWVLVARNILHRFYGLWLNMNLCHLDIAGLAATVHLWKSNKYRMA